MGSETQLLTQIMRALALEPGVYVWRNNTGAIVKHDTLLRFGLGRGSADIIGILKGSGRFIALECKTEEGKLSPDQISWRKRIAEYGGHYGVVRSVADAREEIAKARGK